MSFGIYVHFPYCLTKCPYCDFNSYVAPEIPHVAYADAVLAELETRSLDYMNLRTGDDAKPLTLYFGGGTPGLWEPTQIERIVDAATALGMPRDAEITVEANPGALETRSLTAIRRAGANRISFGCQSFHDHHLEALGRRHSAAEALAAPNNARAAGFENISLDLIFGIPGETVDEWRADLDRALALEPDHLSLYSLSLEPEVPMAREVARGRLKLLDEALHSEMFDIARATTHAAGFRHYEISNYSRPGREAVHNALYWHGTPILACGAGAHGVFETRDGLGHRYMDVKGAETYMSRATRGERPESFTETVDGPTRTREAIMTGLRLIDGIDLTAFERQTGVDFAYAYAAPIARLSQDGLLRVADGRAAVTDRGLFVMNEVLLAFF